MKKETLTCCLTISLVAMGVLSASAQQPEHLGDHQPGQLLGAKTETRPGIQQDVPLRQVQPMARASKLMAMKVHGQDGKQLGEVEEILLSQDRRSVEHLKVSLDDGGSTTLSLDELFATHGDRDVLLVRATQPELKQRQTQVRDRAAVDREQDEQESRRVSKLIGMDMLGTDGKDVGSINDLIIDTQSGRISNAAVKTGGILGLGTSLASVEWQQVNFSVAGDTASINTTKDRLSEQSYKQDEYWERHALISVEALRDTDVDNTERNVRDRNDATLTPFDQGNSKADTDATAKIRREINALDNISVSGKNVKVITRDGRVTLRGPVSSTDEKRRIGEIANRIARPGNVDNQLEVESMTTTTNRD